MRGTILFIIFAVGMPVGIYLTVENSWFLSLSIGALHVLLLATFAKMGELIRTMDKVLEIYYREEKYKTTVQ